MTDTPLPLDTLVGGQSRAHDPSTSAAAATLAKPKQGSQRYRLLAALAVLCRRHPELVDVGFNSTAIQYRDMESGHHAIRIDIARRRLTDLEQLGWIEKSAAPPLQGQCRWVLTAAARVFIKERGLFNGA